MSVIGKELDYQQYAISHGSYQMSQVIQQSGGTAVGLSASGGQESIFELSPKVYNLSRSTLQFTVALPAPGTDYFNWLYLDGIPFIQQLQLYTRSGLFLADIQNVNNYANMTMRRSFKSEDVLTWDKGNYFEGLIPVNDTKDTNLRYEAGSSGSTSYFEPVYLSLAVAKNTAGPTVNVQIELRKIVNSIFSIDKDLYFGGEILYLRVVWNPSTKIAFGSKSATDVETDSIAYPKGITMTNLKLYMAVEQNPTIENELKSKVNSAEGFNLLIPYVYQNKQSLTGTSQNIMIKYSRAHGSKLLKIYWAPYNSTESASTCYDHRNVSQSKVTQFYTLINNVRTSQFNYLCNGDDYMVQKNKLKGSCIYSSNEYYYNWVWVEDFTNNYSFIDKPLNPPEENYIDGLDLSTEIKYDIFANTTNATYNHYVYAICQKTLVVSSSGISLL